MAIKLITRGLGPGPISQGMITQGFGGFFESFGLAIERVVVYGKSKTKRYTQRINEIVIRFSLKSVNGETGPKIIRMLKVSPLGKAILNVKVKRISEQSRGYRFTIRRICT